MPLASIGICLAILSQNSQVKPEHAANPLYEILRRDGWVIEGTSIPFPAPVLEDGQSAADQHAALVALAGSEKKVEDLLRDSISAPSILKVRDVVAKGGTIVRSADLWFVVRADLDAIDPVAIARRASAGEAAEVGNMRFSSRLLDAEELKARNIDEPKQRNGTREWYAHLTGRLLDRIHVEATDHVIVTRTADSLLIASRTDDAFNPDGALANRWWPITVQAGREISGAPHPYAGGASYAKAGRLKGTPGALLVEAHFAFAEPKAWFDGAPILRSKISLAAQDQVRRLRRELARGR